MKNTDALDFFKNKYPEKFIGPAVVFSKIHPGDRIFISTACGEPQYLVGELIKFVQSHPKAICDSEVLHVWTLGIAPYADEKFKKNFRLNSFFVGDNSRAAVNKGAADYEPIFMSQIPSLFRRGLAPINCALIQTSLPDEHGYLSLGVSVDIVKAGVEIADMVVAQVNPNMPRIHGNTFVHIDDIDCLVAHEEPLLEFNTTPPDDIANKIGRYVAGIVEDGDTIQVGYGRIPNAVIANLSDKKHLGVHTELLGEGLVELIKSGVVDNSQKSIDRHKTVATFCMGNKDTYDYLHDNPSISFRPVDYTNDPLVIASHRNMTAINSALQIDLTGQSSSESIGTQFFSGIGGHADFMRGAMLAPGGKTILIVPSTARDGEVSRIVPLLDTGTGVTLTRGDIHYVVSEYGIAYLHGKSIRERAMALIAIAHPKFRSHLIREAKKHNLIYSDQAFIPGSKGEYPENLETKRTTRSGVQVLLRPVKISDEPHLKDFFYSLSDKSIYRRFISARRDMPHERLQDFVIIDYTTEMVILAIIQNEEQELVVGIGQYGIDERVHSAEAAFVVRDNYQNKGIGKTLLRYITFLAKKRGLLGFTAEVVLGNELMLHLFESMGFDITTKRDEGVWELQMSFRREP